MVAANGRFVAFESSATNLPGDGSQIYARDLKQGKTKLVTRTSGGDVVSGGGDDPSISGDGQFVLFESETSDLPVGLGTEDQVYLRDLERGRTTLVSKTSGGDPATGAPATTPRSQATATLSPSSPAPRIFPVRSGVAANKSTSAIRMLGRPSS